MNTNLTQSQVNQVKQIIGKNHGHTFYNNAHHFFVFPQVHNVFQVFSQIQSLGLQVVIGWTYYQQNVPGNTMIQFAVVPQQVKV